MVDRKDWLYALVLVAAMMAFTWVYVSHEHFYYNQDWNFYHIGTWFAGQQLLANPVSFPLMVWLSTGVSGFDIVYTVPVLPFVLLFGESRLAFIAGMVVVYLVPYVLLLGLTARHAMSVSGKRSVLWIGALTAVLIPTLWAPTLRGYPDAGSAALILFCVLYYLRDIEVRKLRRVLIIGALLGLAPLFRRHYLWASVAFTLAVFLHQVFLCWRAGQSSVPRDIVQRVLFRIVPMGLATTLTLGTVGILFLQEKWTHRYLYTGTSASVSFFEALGYFVTAYGALAWAAAIAGYVLAWRTGVFEKRKASFLLIFGIALVTCWMTLAQQLAIHYTLYCTPFIAWGITSLVCVAVDKLRNSREKVLCLVLAVVYTLANWLYAFAPMPVLRSFNINPTEPGMLLVPFSEGDALSRLFSSNYAPLVSDDVKDLRNLTRMLRLMASRKEPILIAGASEFIDADTIRNVEREQKGSITGNELVLLDCSYLDSRDSYPLGRILQSQYVAIPTPPYCIYKDSTINLLKVLIAAFEEKWPLTRDFDELPYKYKLHRDVTVKLYKRRNPTTPSIAVAALEKMRQLAPVKPGGQAPWIATDDPSLQKGDELKNSFSLKSSFTQNRQPEHYLLTAFPLPEHATISGAIVDKLPSLEYAIVVRVVSPSGETLDEKTVDVSKNKLFSCQFDKTAGNYATVSLESNGPAARAITVKTEDLKITPASR